MELFDARTTEILDDGIKARYEHDRNGRYTECYVAKEEGIEVGLLSVDIDPEDEHFIIYDLFVPAAMRKQGIATWMLEAAERMGRKLGYRAALLIPKSLDERFAQDEIEAWYQRRGYERWLEHGANGHVKNLTS